MLSGCHLKEEMMSTSQPKPEIELVTYKKINKGSKLGIAGGTIKVINNCVYLSTANNNLPLIFPNEFRWENGIITDGNIQLKPEQEIRMNGDMLELNNTIIASYHISNNHCLNGVSRALFYIQ